MRILCPEPENYSTSGLALAGRLGNLDARTLPQPQFEALALEYDVLMVRLQHRISGDLIKACPRLRAILSPTTGLDHIDLGVADARGVRIFSLKGEVLFLTSISSTAEHTFALLLALVRRMVPSVEAVKEGRWEQAPFRGHNLQGATLGILGYGRIGTMVAEYGQAFGMRVLAYDPYVDRYPAHVTRVPSLDTLLRESNVLSVHVPLEPATRGMIGARELRLLPRGALLINTARGAVVDEGALLHALSDGHLGGAGLDVLEGEPEIGPAGRALIAWAATHDTLLITPHLGGATEEAVEKTDLFVLEKFRMWAENRTGDRQDSGPGYL